MFVQNDITLKRRVFVMCVIIALTFVVIFGRIVDIQLINGLSHLEENSKLHMKTQTLPALRGAIYDNSGSIVFAKSVNRYDVSIDQTLVPIWCSEKDKNVDCQKFINDGQIKYSGILGLAQFLSPYLNVDVAHLAYDLTGTNRHKTIAKNLKPLDATIVRDLGISFMSVELSTERIYPQGNLAGSIIGAATTHQGGKINAVSGLELLANQELSGVDGISSYEVSSTNMKITESEETEIVKMQNGVDIKSSIDSDVQWKLQNTLNETKDKYKANWTMGGIIKIKTGEILAIAHDYEPSAGSDIVKEKGSTVMNSAFEPGSTMKVITAAGLINDSIATPESKYQLPTHELTTAFAPDPIHDATTHLTGPWTLAGIVGNSFNTGTVIASRPWSLDSRYDTFTRFGFGRLTGSNFPGESAGIFSSPQYWDGRTRDTILFGQGISVSALQLLKAYAIIGNNGVNVTPTFISMIRPIDSGNDWKPYNVENDNTQVISSDAAEKVRQILETCTEYGICKQGQIPNYRIGAKTGTAEQIPTTNIVHSFIGMFPMDDPQYVVGIWASHKDAVSTNNITIPSFKDVANFVIQKYGINPSTPASYIPPTQ